MRRRRRMLSSHPQHKDAMKDKRKKRGNRSTSAFDQRDLSFLPICQYNLILGYSLRRSAFVIKILKILLLHLSNTVDIYEAIYSLDLFSAATRHAARWKRYDFSSSVLQSADSPPQRRIRFGYRLRVSPFRSPIKSPNPFPPPMLRRVEVTRLTLYHVRFIPGGI